MKALLLTSVLLIVLGVAIILFEELVANNKASYHPCPRDMHCDFGPPQDQISIGIFPVIAGAMIFGFHGVKIKRSPNLSRAE